MAAVAAALFVSSLLAAQPPDKSLAVARKALDLLLAEKYTDLRAMLTPAAAASLSIDVLHDRVGGEIRTFGQLGAIGQPAMAKDGDNTLVSFPLLFAATKVNIQFTLNPSLAIAGVYLRPPDAPLPRYGSGRPTAGPMH